jgi:hypothetical protein
MACEHHSEMTQAELLAALQERWRTLQPDGGFPGELDALTHAIQRLLGSLAAQRQEHAR